MDQEFQEADVLWPDHHHHRADDDHHRCRGHGHGYQQPQRRGESRRQPPHHVDVARAPRQVASSAPVGIPDVRSSLAMEQGSWAARKDDGDDVMGRAASASASASFVAPHEMAARRRCGEGVEERSVCVGHGRTLKGRDLRSVRTAVLRMTGFLET